MHNFCVVCTAVPLNATRVTRYKSLRFFLLSNRHLMNAPAPRRLRRPAASMHINRRLATTRHLIAVSGVIMACANLNGACQRTFLARRCAVRVSIEKIYDLSSLAVFALSPTEHNIICNAAAAAAKYCSTHIYYIFIYSEHYTVKNECRPCQQFMTARALSPGAENFAAVCLCIECSDTIRSSLIQYLLYTAAHRCS